MKKILSFLGTITLIGTSTTSLVACNTPQKYTPEELAKIKEQNNIKTKDGILEWIAPQEAPFNQIDNKYYFVVWRSDKNADWRIIKFNNNEKIRLNGGFKLVLDYYGKVDEHNKINLVFDTEINNLRANGQIWTGNSPNFKSVYRWNSDTVPNIVIENKLKSYLDLQI